MSIDRTWLRLAIPAALLAIELVLLVRHSKDEGPHEAPRPAAEGEALTATRPAPGRWSRELDDRDVPATSNQFKPLQELRRPGARLHQLGT